MRIPPGLKSKQVIEVLRQKFEAPGDELFGAEVIFECTDYGDGFDAPDLPSHFKDPLNEAVAEVFNGAPPLYFGCGASIPFMEVFSEKFEGVNFLLTGVGFPDSNFHAANENLRLDFCRKLTLTISLLLSKMK